jgi:hypothetical protein
MENKFDAQFIRDNKLKYGSKIQSYKDEAYHQCLGYLTGSLKEIQILKHKIAALEKGGK